MKKYTWIKAAGIRALKTLAQTAIATIGTAAVLGDVDWKIVLSASALAALLSILTSIATGLPEVDDFDDVAEDEEEKKWQQKKNSEQRLLKLPDRT